MIKDVKYLPVRFKKLHPDAVAPIYGTEFSAGADLTAVSDPIIGEGYIEYKTGLAVEIPVGYVGLIFPRSSISKKSMILANGVGVIDADYRGEISFRFKKMKTLGDEYAKGDRIGQMIIVPFPVVQYEEVDELSETVRGVGGYGSTGK